MNKLFAPAAVCLLTCFFSGASLAATCMGMEVTVDIRNDEQPTDGPDVIRGTAGDDFIDAGDGDDIICGLGGDDEINGEDGDDTIRGQNGDDIIDGGNGEDFIWGNDGNDSLFGGGGEDFLSGQDGNDIIEGGPAGDIIYGGKGNDTLYSVDLNAVAPPTMLSPFSEDEDELFGGAGDDDLFGSSGFDFLAGNSGEDFLYGLGNSDTLRGGMGDDVLCGGEEPITDDIVFSSDLLIGGGGFDSCTASAGDEEGPNCEQAFVPDSDRLNSFACMNVSAIN